MANVLFFDGILDSVVSLTPAFHIMYPKKQQLG